MSENAAEQPIETEARPFDDIESAIDSAVGPERLESVTAWLERADAMDDPGETAGAIYFLEQEHARAVSMLPVLNRGRENAVKLRDSTQIALNKLRGGHDG